MLLTLVLAMAVATIVSLLLAFIGRMSLQNAVYENDRLGMLVKEFHQDLVAYANSQGRDQDAFQRLAMKSTEVERALGWDNIVNGVRLGMYMMNGARLLPLAIHEMRREYGEGSSWRDRGGEIADAVQTVLFRHLGRRAGRANRLIAEAGSFGSCLFKGWSTLTALPIHLLSTFGLLNLNKAEAARQSLLFKLWNLVLALAAMCGPLFAYLADREKIDAAVSALL